MNLASSAPQVVCNEDHHIEESEESILVSTLQDVFLLDVPVIVLDKAAPFESTMHAREAHPSLRVRP